MIQLFKLENDPLYINNHLEYIVNSRPNDNVDMVLYSTLTVEPTPNYIKHNNQFKQTSSYTKCEDITARDFFKAILNRDNLIKSEISNKIKNNEKEIKHLEKFLWNTSPVDNKSRFEKIENKIVLIKRNLSDLEDILKLFKSEDK